MTETPDQTPTEDTQEDAEAQALLAEAADSDTDTTEAAEGGNREAARYRRRLRDTEAQRDTLAERVAGFQRAEAERIAASGPRALNDGADLWSGVELAEVLDDQGNVSPDAVADAVKGVLSDKPHYAKPAPDLKQGQRGGTPKPPARPGAIFARSEQ